MQEAIKKCKKDERGASLVEFSLIALLFFAIIFGIMEFGWFFFVQNTLQYGTREGARLALVGRQLDDGEGGQLSREASIIKTIRSEVSLAVDPDQVFIYIFPVTETYQEPNNWSHYGGNATAPGQPDAGAPGTFVQIKTRYHHQFLTPLIRPFFAQGKTLVQSQTTYRNEQFNWVE